MAENVLAFDRTFWLRLATRADTALSEDDRVRGGYLCNSEPVVPPNFCLELGKVDTRAGHCSDDHHMPEEPSQGFEGA